MKIQAVMTYGKQANGAFRLWIDKINKKNTQWTEFYSIQINFFCQMFTLNLKINQNDSKIDGKKAAFKSIHNFEPCQAFK